MTNEHLVPDWEKELDKENWHAIEGGNGRCACGSEQGICHTRLKSFIRSLLSSHHAHLKERVTELEKQIGYNLAAGNIDEEDEIGYRRAISDVLKLLE